MQTQKSPYRHRIELLQGTFDLLILTTLQWGPQHSYGASLAIQANSAHVLRVETGSLYPALHRLEKQGWVAGEWKHTEAKRRSKFYRLPTAGKRQCCRAVPLEAACHCDGGCDERGTERE